MKNTPANNPKKQNRASKEERSSRALTGSANPGKEPRASSASDAVGGGGAGGLIKVRLKLNKPIEYLGREFSPSEVYDAERTNTDAMGQKLPRPAIWVNGVLWEHGFDVVLVEAAEGGRDSAREQSGAGLPSAAGEQLDSTTRAPESKL